MMKRIAYYIVFAIFAVLCTNCADEKLVQSGTIGDKEVWVTIPFGHTDFERTTVTTRSTLSEVAESRVKDLYLFIFSSEGKNIYSHYFGDDAKKASASEVTNAGNEQCWYVSNRTSMTNADQLYPEGDTEDTHGSIHIRCPEITNGTLYLIANANAYTVNISPDKLGTIRTKADLEKLTATLTGNVVTRYGYFPMVATVEDVSVNGTAMTANEAAIHAELVRLDAKVEVKVKANIGGTSTYNGESVTISNFTPESWRVMNVPKGAFVLENTGGNDDITGYFNTEAVGFESSEQNEHSFSFYMLENRFVVPSTATGTENDGTGIYISDYHQRNLRKKNSSGQYLYPLPEKEGDETNIWKYAPEYATYLVIKGYLAMEFPEGAESGNHELGANVTYYIHLGEFGSSGKSGTVTGFNNYSIERNTHYTYTITINGVTHIETEVSKNEENQTGATGDIFASKDEVHLFDAHYGQYTTSIHVDNLDYDNMSWFVKTPFGDVGSPKLTNGTDPDNNPQQYENELAEFDYKWVWFMINPRNSDGSYDKNNQWYPGNQYRTANNSGTMNVNPGDEKCLMDVDEFVKYIREQNIIYDADKADNDIIDGEALIDGEMKTHIFRDDKIYFTIFLDEYYYEKHPVTNAKSTDLWKQFVNQPNRLVHILCGSNFSLDGESSTTNSVITIRQRSIQTPYNITKDALQTAWGCETEDETADEQLWLYDEINSRQTVYLQNAYKGTIDSNIHTATTDNTSENNGLYNTALMLGLMNTNTYAHNGEISWAKFLNYTNTTDMRQQMSPFLNTNHKGMLYSILMRNRDNDGDGIIDADELRWYVASVGQLYGIYVGERGFTSPDAWLYDEKLGQEEGSTLVGGNGNFANYFKWRSHVVSSTKSNKGGSNGRTTVVWAEEGISVSFYFQEQDDSWTTDYGSFSIRCVRNLGIDHTNEQDARNKIVQESEQPEMLVKCSTESSSIDVNTVYTFDLSNVNDNSLRPLPLGDLEMEATDEFDDSSRPYKGFKTGALVTTVTDYVTLKNNYLDLGNSPCPVGYHVPNVREAALMYLYCTEDSWWNDKDIMSGSYYSNGSLGNGKINKTPTWYFYNNFVSIDKTWTGRPTAIRAIMDWDPN